MSILNNTKQAVAGLFQSVGKGVASSLYPDDFEVYITALELVDSQNNIADYFLWPLNPNQINKTTNQILSVKKTAGGITTLSTENFMPSMINLSGNFGRKFKLLLGKELVDADAYAFGELLGGNTPSPQFSPFIKTGYGCIKILEKMIKKSNQLDRFGKPYFLYLYNLNFGESYIVKCTGQPSFSQNMEQNMIWQYSINFQTLGSLDNIQSSDKLSNLETLKYSSIQKILNGITADAEQAVRSIIG